MGICRRNAKQVKLTTEERTLAMNTLLRLDKIYNGRISATAGPLAEARAWLEMEEAHQQGKVAMPEKGSLTSCGGVFQTIAVRADGVIVPCSLLSHIELGRINRDSLLDIWQNHPEFKKLRERRSISLNDFEYCSGCDYINYCRGSCPALAYTLMGEVHHPSPDSCLRKFLEEGGRLPRVSLSL